MHDSFRMHILHEMDVLHRFISTKYLFYFLLKLEGGLIESSAILDLRCSESKERFFKVKNATYKLCYRLRRD